MLPPPGSPPRPLVCPGPPSLSLCKDYCISLSFSVYSLPLPHTHFWKAGTISLSAGQYTRLSHKIDAWVTSKWMNESGMRYQCTVTRLTQMKESNNTKCWRGCGTTNTCISSWQEMVWLYLVKFRMNRSHEPAVLLLCVYTREMCAKRH